MNPKRFCYLLWKDFWLIRSLLGAGILGVVILFPMGSLAESLMQHRSVAYAFALWGFLPFVVALGAPPTLIGNENERGTMDWLRGLPAPWWCHLLSKVLVGIATWLIVYCLASLALAIIVAGIPVERNALTAFNFFVSMGMHLAVLLFGFVMAFVFRNGLVSTVVTMFGGIASLYLTIFVAGLAHALARGWMPRQRGSTPGFEISLIVAWTLFGIAALLWLARHRLAGFSDQAWWRRSRPIPNRPELQPLRPLATVDLGCSSRPGLRQALLWQQIRQNRWILLGCAVSGLLFSLKFATSLNANFAPLAMSFVSLCCVFLGVSCFHGERLYSRGGFFADRGVSRWTFWWTRLLPAATVTLGLLLMVQLWRTPFSDGDAVNLRDFEARMSVLILVGPIVFFTIGVIVGQCAGRAMVAFFAAPILAIWWMMPVQAVVNLYPEYFWLIAPALLVLLGGTWILTPAVMENRTGSGLVGRGLAYGLAGWLVLFVLTGNLLYWSTPPAQPQHAEQLRQAYGDLSKSSPEPTKSETGDTPIVRLALDGLRPVHTYDYVVTANDWSEEELAQMTPERLSQYPKRLAMYPLAKHGTDQVLRNIRFNEDLRNVRQHLEALREGAEITVGSSGRKSVLLKLVSSTNTDFRQLGTEVALREATLARQTLCDSDQGLQVLMMIAESYERIGLYGLQQMMSELASQDSGFRQRFDELVELIPDDRLRARSRRSALLREWHQFDNGVWPGARGGALQTTKQFAGRTFTSPRYQLNLERTRTTRWIDRGASTVLNQLQRGLASVWDRRTQELIKIWDEVFRRDHFEQRPTTSDGNVEWLRDSKAIPASYPVFLIEHEQLIERLRSAAQGNALLPTPRSPS